MIKNLIIGFAAFGFFAQVFHFAVEKSHYSKTEVMCFSEGGNLINGKCVSR